VRRVFDGQRGVSVVHDGLAEERARRREAVVEGARARLHGRRGDGRVVGLRRRGGRARRARGRRHVQRAIRVRDERRGRRRGGRGPAFFGSPSQFLEVPVRKSTSASGRPGGIIYYSGRLDAARECLASSHERLISAQVKYFCACERHCVVDRVPTAAATFGQRRRAGSTATMAS
jgi:hypothetical protein